MNQAGHDLADGELRVGHVDRGGRDDAERADEHGGDESAERGPPGDRALRGVLRQVAGVVGAGAPRQRAGRDDRVAEQQHRPVVGDRHGSRLVREVGGAEHEHGQHDEGHGERGREHGRELQDGGVAVDAEHEAQHRDHDEHDPLGAGRQRHAEDPEQRVRGEGGDGDVDDLVEQADGHAEPAAEDAVAAHAEHGAHDGDARRARRGAADGEPADGRPPQVADDRDGQRLPDRQAEQHEHAAEHEVEVVHVRRHPHPEQLARAAVPVGGRDDVDAVLLDVPGAVGRGSGGVVRGGGDVRRRCRLGLGGVLAHR